MSDLYTTTTTCECCGAAPATVHYGEADTDGHVWQHSVCQGCYDGCTSDEEGRPVHQDPTPYEAALAAGRHLLTGGDAAPSLAGEEALAAAEELTRRLPAWTAEAGELGPKWDDCVDPAEAQELCARLLKFRMDALAVMVALDEVWSAAAAGSAIDRAMWAAGREIDRFDAALESRADLLSTLCGTRLLENWRSELSDRYPLPWWLDGRLEKLAKRISEEA